MSSQTTSSTAAPKKKTTTTTKKTLLKEGESRNHAGFPIFVGYALVLLLFTWGILARRLAYLRKIYSEGVTRCDTLQLQWAWHNCLTRNLRSITCFGISSASTKSSAVFRKQACTCISLLQSAEARRPLLTKRWKESSSISSICSFKISWCFWLAKQWERQHSHHLHFFCGCVELVH